MLCVCDDCLRPVAGLIAGIRAVDPSGVSSFEVPIGNGACNRLRQVINTGIRVGVQ